MERVIGYKRIIIITTATILVVTIILTGCVRNKEVTPTPPSDNSGIKKREGNVHGRIMNASDVQTLPDTPLQDVLVLAIRSDQFHALLSKAEKTERIENLWNARFSINEELFQKHIEKTTMSQRDGEYVFRLPAGSYLLCLANLPQRSELFPVDVVGCIEAIVPEQGLLEKDIFWWGYSGAVSSP